MNEKWAEIHNRLDGFDEYGQVEARAILSVLQEIIAGTK